MGQDKNTYQKTQLDLELGCKMVAAKVNAQVPYCDVIVKVEDTIFFSSRLILGAWSPYFDQIFTTAFKEATEKEVHIEGVSKMGFRGVWEFLHGPEFVMDGEDGTLAILRDAHFLGIQHLCSIISRKLIDILELRNVFLFLRTAQELNEKDLEERILGFMARRFNEIVTTPGFLQITFETLKGLLLRDDLEVKSEEAVFDASKRWIEQDQGRKEYLPQVLDAIRLPLVSLDFLKRNVIADPLIRGDPRCAPIISEAKDFYNPDFRDTVPIAKTIQRGPKFIRGIDLSKGEAPERHNEEMTLAEKMKQKCKSIDGFIHELPQKKIMEDPKNRLAKFEIGERGAKCGPGKVLMLVGATGAGKTTLINGMMNYVYGVKWEDPFRFKLIKDRWLEARSQTKWITAYVLHQQEGFRLPCTLTLIGFGDTEGIMADKELIIQIHEFFSHGGNIGVDQLDGICFVIQASLPRLTHTQKYIFDSILAVFGKDVENIIYVLTTSASREKPPVLTALKDAKIPSRNSFKVNNSAFFVKPSDEPDAEDYYSLFLENGNIML
ncbi:unnamed protein product [Darwinula stevensoni]|uniref:BTB domain-containing protein n=1 Tax=Darwinula stevensoni TaxID=69355 RepID=A0A7R9ADV6_9CRUS|nr:unnamed protein product [Darwinula stevensoni]CAG0901469.1 unnamed protein product [Darwinula stevensoni]